MTAYPGAIDTFVDPNPTDPMNNPSHAGEHDLENDAIKALETAVGTTGAFNFLPVVGGTMSGAIAMGSNKGTGLANGSASGDAVAYGQLSPRNQIIFNNNAVTVSSNAATVPVTYQLTTVTNNAAGSVTITITTAGATDGQPLIVRYLDYSA